MWSHEFKLSYRVTLRAGQLETELSITNTDVSDYAVQALLHTYLRVPDITTVAVGGLQGIRYIDQLVHPTATTAPNHDEHGGVRNGVETRSAIGIDTEVDRIMIGAASTTSIDDDMAYDNDTGLGANAHAHGVQAKVFDKECPGRVHFTVDRHARMQSNGGSSSSTSSYNVNTHTDTNTNTNSSSSSSSNSSGIAPKVAKSSNAALDADQPPDIISIQSMQCDTVFWNGWKDKCHRLADMDNNAYEHYVCIEPGVGIHTPMTIKRGDTLHLKQVLSSAGYTETLARALAEANADEDDDTAAVGGDTSISFDASFEDSAKEATAL